VAVLLVEDNPQLTATLARGMEEHGFTVEVERSGRGALDRLLNRDCDAVILDLGLPDLDGLDVLAQARAGGVAAPVLVLTARGEVQSRVSALDLGADDYLVKPFEFAELVARVRALLRRSSGPRYARASFGGLRLDPDSRSVHIGGRSIALSPREHALLRHLLRLTGGVASRQDLLANVFDSKFDPGTNVVEVHIANLRRKLAGTAVTIENVRASGYRLRHHETKAPSAAE